MAEEGRKSSRKRNATKKAPPTSMPSIDGPGKRERSPEPDAAGHARSRDSVRKSTSATSLSNALDRTKRARLRPGISRDASTLSVPSRPGAGRNNSAMSIQRLLLVDADDVAITSADDADSVMGSSIGALRSAPHKDMPLVKPDWVVRQRIYLNNELISTTTSTQRPSQHKFQDVLLREQLELRLNTLHNGEQAHFATRHATLRFWKADGSLAEKWMDKDYNGTKEHEFGLENLNDWVILQLSMGFEEESTSDSDDDEEGRRTSREDETSHSNKGEMTPSIDIISHYVGDYKEARNIASAPGISDDSDTGEEVVEPKTSPSTASSSSRPNFLNGDVDMAVPDVPALERKTSAPVYHWVEVRRRDLEHQLRTAFHCQSTACFNKGGTCLALSPTQHLGVTVKDLTDWSQQIAHAHRSIAASTLHLAAKLVDDRVRAHDERLADVGKERDDEDDLLAALGTHDLLADLRPAGARAAVADLEWME